MVLSYLPYLELETQRRLLLAVFSESFILNYHPTMFHSRPTSAWMSSQVAETRPTTARPRTGQSRPGTARPQTAVSVRHEGSYVIAVFEGRGVAKEVGMAAIDKDTGKVMLVQVKLIFRSTACSFDAS